MERDRTEPTDELWRALRDDVMRRGADLHTAEDVVQEVWLQVARRPPEDRGRFRGWLYVVASRCLRQMRESQRVHSEHSACVAREDSTLPAEEATEPTALVRFVDELPALYRDVVRLRFLEDRSVEEIARLTGRSEEAVRTQLKRGVQRLRARLGAEPEQRRGAWLGFGWLAALLRKPRRKAIAASGMIALAIGSAMLLRESSEEQLSLGPALADGPRAMSGAVLELAADMEDTLPGRVSVAAESVERVAPFVTGTVRMADGSPVSGATVYAMPSDGSREMIETESDTLGRYSIAAGRHDILWATHPSALPSNGCYIASCPADSDLDLDLGRAGAIVEFRVLSADGDPVVGADISATARANLPEQASVRETLQFAPARVRFTTDAEGRARVPLPAQAMIELCVEMGEETVFSRWTSTRDAAKSTEITLPRTTTAHGTVVDPTGTSARNASVEVLQLDGRRLHQSLSDADGAFQVEGLLPGPFVLRVLEDPNLGTASARHEGEVSGTDPIDVGKIELVEEGTIHGRVFRNALPAAGVHVSLRTERPNSAERGAMRTTTTDANGRYVFGGCATWNIYTVFTTPEAGPFHGDLAPARPGQAPIDLRAELGGPTAPVVLEFTGDSAPRMAEVRREPCASQVLEAEGDAHLFRSAPLPAGSYEVLAWLSELGTWHCGTIVHDPLVPTVHTFETPGGAQLSIEVVVPKGFDPKKTWVGLLTLGFATYSAKNLGTMSAYIQVPWDESQGAFTAIVAPQTYSVATWYPGLADTTTRVAVQDGRDNRVLVRHAPGIQVRLVFRSSRTMIRGEVICLDFDSPHGPVQRELYWTDYLEHELGFAFDARIPQATSEIRVRSRLRPSERVLPLQGTRSVVPEELVQEPRELEIVLE